MGSWQIETYLTYQKGFRWHSQGGFSAKGFIFSPEGEYLEGEKFTGYLSAIGSLEEIKSVIRRANGLFSLVIKQNEECLLAADPFRTFPLLYSFSGGSIFISDSFDTLLGRVGRAGWNREARSDFRACGLVTGKETLAEGIQQVRAGETVVIHAKGGRLDEEFYHTYQADHVFQEGEEQLSGELEQLLENVGRRLVDSLQGRHAVISLSGGYDSRLVACMLKSAGYTDVTCLTYGRRGNPDMVMAEKVADVLQYPWLCIEYTDDLIKDYIDDPGFPAYYRYAANGVSMFFLQDYFAIKHMRENKAVPDDSVFIPGHSGDFLGGTFIIKHNLRTRPETAEELVNRIWHSKYTFCTVSRDEQAELKRRIHKTLAEKRVLDNALSYTIHEDWDLKEKIAKFIVNSTRVYDWFGYEYRLPLWDVELTDFFRQVPYDMKINWRFYDAVLKRAYFSRFDLDFPVELRPSARTQRAGYIKSRIKAYLPRFAKRFLLDRNDDIFYYEITRELQRDMEKRGTPIRIYNNSFNTLIVQWYLEMMRGDLDENGIQNHSP